jgi:hypothetical protein
MSEKPALMEGYADKQLMNQPEKARERYESYPLQMCRWMAEDTAQRVSQSSDWFPHQFLRGDCHSHTVHSDGAGTVAQTAEMRRAAGLDFQFVTDHWGVTQKDECLENDLWFGQEPVTAQHHLGILGLDFAFTPQMDFLEDCRRAKELGATIFVPHPCGWWPKTVYTEEQKQVLFQLPDPFLMEICNGANNIVSAFDYTDDAAVGLWDKLLLAGKKVHAMGNTDAHAPHAIGMVWNGVLTASSTQSGVLQALSAGQNFVSDGPLLSIQSGETMMGSTVAKNSEVTIHAADSRGLLLLRIIADGKEILRRDLQGDTAFEHTLRVGGEQFVRAEIISRDGRRAFSNPIYFA